MKSEWINIMVISAANNTGMDSLCTITGKSFMYRRKSKCPTMFNFRQVRKGNAVMLFNSLNAKLNPICHVLALLEAHHILHVSGVRVNVHGYSLLSVIQVRIILYYIILPVIP
jgi:hypothetical protein